MNVRINSGTLRTMWGVPLLLVLLSVVPVLAGTARLSALVKGGNITAANARFFAQPLPVALHILGAIPFSIVGAFQFSAALRRRYRGWHRSAGKVLIVCGLVVALSGLWMTENYPWPLGDGRALYVLRLIFGTAMLGSILLSVRAVMRRDFADHGAWMMRAYAIGVGAGTQALTHLPWFLLVGKPTEGPRAVLMGAGWVINLGVAEWIIGQVRRRATTAPPPPSVSPVIAAAVAGSLPSESSLW